MIYALLSSLSKKQIQIICRRKPFLSIGTITNSIKCNYPFILERIVEIIEEIVKLGYEKKSALFITRKIVGEAGILKKSVKIQRRYLKSSSLDGFINKKVIILQNMKELITSKMMIQKALITQ